MDKPHSLSLFSLQCYQEINNNEYEFLKLTSRISFMRNNLRVDYPFLSKEEKVDISEKPYKNKNL